MEDQTKENQQQYSDPTPETPGSQQTDPGKDVEENKFWAALSYFGILCVIPLLGKKESPFCQFHAKQGLVITLGWLLAWFPIFGWILGIILFVHSIIGIVNALTGKRDKLWIVGDLAEKLNI